MAFSARGQVLLRDSHKPVVKVQVAPIVKVRNDNAALKAVITDEKGRFEVSVDEKQWLQFLKSDDAAYVFFRVMRPGDKYPIADTQGTFRWRPEAPLKGKQIIISVNPPAVEPPKPESLDQLNAKLRLGLSADLIKSLNDQGIETLNDIIKKGGLSKLGELYQGHEAAFKTLDAQANLSLISPDLELSSQLIAAGYSDVLDIARSPTPSFRKAVPKIDENTALDIHTRALAVENTLYNLGMDVRIRGLRDDLANIDGFYAKDMFAKSCGCEGCQNAASPLAYLADLLDYATRHVLINGHPATLTALEGRFHQPFRGLPATCDAMDALVRQARICIEVLRQILPAASQKVTPQWYLQAAYFQLLQGAGTSFDELRADRSRPQKFRAPLAEKLQIPFDPVAPGGAQFLDQLFRDPNAFPADTEHWLQGMFGLRDTTIDPLTPDPPSCQLEVWRRSYWLAQWEEQDWNADVTVATLGRFPIIDPDVIGYADLKNMTPAAAPRATRPKTQWAAVDFYEDRRSWIDVSIAELRTYQQANGLPALLTALQNPFTVPNVGASVMTGITATTLLDHLNQQNAAVDISAWLTQVGLSLTEFALLSEIAQLDHLTQPILSTEWDQFFSVVIKRAKELAMYSVWRTEESATQAAGGSRISLTSKHFQIVPESMLPGGTGWIPVPYRSTQAMRDNWEEALQGRLDREQEITDQIDAAVDATEGALLTELRNDLLRTAAQLGLLGPTSTVGSLLNPTQTTWFTRFYQIDCEASGCQKTTRISQAIQTIQGIIFDARTGLLPDGSIVLTDTDAFDQEWQWMGSYTSWRAAIMVFLYPENVLRPTFRKRQSPGFENFIDAVRDAGPPVAQNMIGPLADYEDYFRDVCSLATEGLLEAAGLIALSTGVQPVNLSAVPWYDQGDVIALAIGGETGSHYYSVWRRLPGWGLRGSPDQSLWRKIDGLDPNMTLVSTFAYARALGVVGVALYYRGRQNGEYYYQLGSYSASSPDTISVEPLDEFQVLVNTSGEVDVTIPPSPQRSLAGGTGWILDPADQFCTADVDGNGRDEVVAFAGQLDADGKRKVGLLREMGGSLVLDQMSALPGGWQLPDPSRPVIFTTGTLQRILVVDSISTQIATVGWVGASLQVINPTTQVTGPAGSWQLTGRPAIFTSARIDSANKKLIVFEYGTGNDPDYAPIGTFVTVMTWAADRFSLQTLPNELKHPFNGNEFPGREDAQPLFSVKWERFLFLPRRFGPQGALDHTEEDLLVFARRTKLEVQKVTIPHGGTTWNQVEEDSNSLCVFTWDGTQFKVQPAIRSTYQDDPDGPIVAGGPGTSPWPIDQADHFILATPPSNWNRPSSLLYYSKQMVALNQAQRAIAIIGPMVGDPESVDPNAEMYKVVWEAKNQIQPASSDASLWLISTSDYILSFDIDADGQDEILIINPDSGTMAILLMGTDLSLKVQFTFASRVVLPGSVNGWSMLSTTQIISGDIDGDTYPELLAMAVDDNELRLGVLRGVTPPIPRELPAVPNRFGPLGVPPIPVFQEPMSGSNLYRQQQIQLAYTANLVPGLDENIIYLDEAFYFFPIEIALRLMKEGDYEAALDWLRLVYDYENSVANRKIAYKLVLDTGQPDFTRQTDWLRDPLDPHAIADSRKDSYNRFTIITIVQCLLAYGDSEFTQATSESLPHARDLYLKALELLGTPELLQHISACSDLVGRLTLIIGTDEVVLTQIPRLGSQLQSLDYEQIPDVLAKIENNVKRYNTPLDKLAAARATLGEAVNAPPPARTLEQAITAEQTLKQQLSSTIASLLIGKDSLSQFSSINYVNLGRVHTSVIPAPSFTFCIPENPVISALNQHAQNDLAKLRNCRNIAGLMLVVDPYPVATVQDTVTDQLPSARTSTLQPLPYRYATLIERAKQLIELARQMESSMLQFLTSAEQERYQDIKARQDLGLAYASLKLKDLQVVQAQDGVAAARLQKDRATLQQQHYQDLTNAGLSTNETLGLGFLVAAAAHQHASAGADWYGIFSGLGAGVNVGDVAGALSATSQALSLTSQTFFQTATFERRAQDWQFQGALAGQDIAIGQQQIQTASDQVQVVQQDRAVSQLQVQNAQNTLDFLLTGKLLGVALYEWMSSVTESTYRFFLQQATSMAKLAALQLGFERQEVIPNYIKDDYWEPPSDGQTPDLSVPGSSEPPNLHGLTGSARLLRDIYELDQYAFETNQRKLQLSVSISLSQLDPIAFQNFRSTGVLPFNITSEYLDRVFPGQYLRLVHGVKVSVIALIPPSYGIRATFSSVGNSYTVIGGDTFQRVRVQSGPETIALTSPINANGVFEMDAQPDLLAPFEGMGAEAAWEFRMPRSANPVDYSAVADVLFNLQYTALHNYDYEQQVLGSLSRDVDLDRAFSLRQDFPDAWYDLHHPEAAEAPNQPLTVTFEIEDEDFPPNLDRPIRIKQLSLYFVPASGSSPQPVKLEHLSIDTAGVAASANAQADGDGIISTRRGWNAPSGVSPVGDWELKLVDDPPQVTRGYFKNEQIQDILFVISYSAKASAWPV